MGVTCREEGVILGFPPKKRWGPEESGECIPFQEHEVTQGRALQAGRQVWRPGRLLGWTWGPGVRVEPVVATVFICQHVHLTPAFLKNPNALQSLGIRASLSIPKVSKRLRPGLHHSDLFKKGPVT